MMTTQVKLGAIMMATHKKRDAELHRGAEKGGRYWGIVFIVGIMCLSIRGVWFPFDTDDATGVLWVTCGICSGRGRGKRGEEGWKDAMGWSDD